jgi:hypothetical protein
MTSLITYVSENINAGRAKIPLPIQMRTIAAMTIGFEVRAFIGQTIALYLE